MKILQILPGITLGGPSVSVTKLTQHIRDLGFSILLFTQHNEQANKPYSELDLRTFKINKWFFLKPLAYSRQLLKDLKTESRSADIIQTNSLWQYPNFVLEKARKKTKAKSIIVPRGTLSEYALSISPIKKKIILALGQRKALKNADMFIATCKKEYEDIRRYGLKQPVAIIPNGLDLPEVPAVSKKKQILFLARIHKIKGVDILVEAWRELESDPRFKEWSLIIAGPKSSEYAKQVINSATALKRISFIGEVFDEDKTRLMAESSIYVLPTHSENFGITVAEALACETPVITTTGAPWSGLEDNNCGRWIELTVDNLKDKLAEMMLLPQNTLIEMGKNGREWIKRDFGWNKIAEQTIKTYKWLLDPQNNSLPFYIKTN